MHRYPKSLLVKYKTIKPHKSFQNLAFSEKRNPLFLTIIENSPTLNQYHKLQNYHPNNKRSFTVNNVVRKQ